MALEHRFMKRAIELAYLGLGKVSPNPMVGCVIVRDGKIIGEGWHQLFGGPHAEVNAINSLIEPEEIKGSDVYVTLEPCAHHGKTPPCAELLVKSEVKNVFIANLDPNPLVEGKGIDKLKSGSIHVKLNVCDQEGKTLNKRFFTYHLRNRPYIILKWAQTVDRFIAKTNFDSKWISNVYSRQLVHKWRAEEDAVMIGANTAIFDNPHLNVRDWAGQVRQPLRVVLDPDLKIPRSYHIFDGSQKTWIYNHKLSETDNNIQWKRASRENFIGEILSDLYEAEILSVMVEGGSYLMNSLISKDLWDEARIFISDKTFGEGIKAPDLYNARLEEKRMVFNDELLLFKKSDG